MERDPLLRWKLSQPVSSKVVFLNPTKLRICQALYGILCHFAREMYCKASLLIDYSHYFCTMQLSRISFMELSGFSDIIMFTTLLSSAEFIDFDEAACGGFAITMEFQLFEQL